MGHGGKLCWRTREAWIPTSSIYFLGLSVLSGFLFCLFALKDDKELAESRTGQVTGTQWGLDKQLGFLLLVPLSATPSLTGCRLVKI